MPRLMPRPGSRIRVGISSCLLGQEVRYDGGHKRDHYITDTLGKFFVWVPVCPELEAGFGVPRPTLRLEGDPDDPRLVFTKERTDQTDRMMAWTRGRLAELDGEDLSGYILKKGSPSCGMERVRVYASGSAMAGRRGAGVFARALQERFPLLPVEEEGRLYDLPLRENFVERVFAYRRWRDLVAAGLTRGRLVAFHTAHKFQILAHSTKHYTLLGQLVARASSKPAGALEEEYGALFMEALRVKATRGKHANVLQHLLGFFKRDASSEDRAEALSVIDEYRRGLVPLVVPLTLLKHHLRRFDVPYVRDQVYLHPHPKELMLRNHV